MKILCNIGILCWMELCLALTRSISDAQELYPPSPDFDRHTIVRPVLLHKRTKREIATTRDTSGLHHLEVTLKVPIDGEEYILDLRLNRDLVPESHVLSYQENGNTVLHKPTKEEMDLCHYGGSVHDRPGSWVAVSTCHGVQGVVFDGERMRYIEPARGGGDVNSDHYIYDQSDLTKTHPRQCGIQGTNNTWRNSHEGRKTRYKRGAPDYESRQANEHSLYVELVLVVDNKLFEAYHRDRHSVHREMKVLANILNSMFSSLNIYIVLVGVVIWNEHDLIALERNSHTVLHNFNTYRTTTLLKEIRHDNAHLVTHQEFDDYVVGLAFVGTMCRFGESCGIANYNAEVVGALAWTIAHEMGHNFGMAHDADGVNCECPSKKCFMGAEGSGGEGGWRGTDNRIIPSHWSSCSLNTLVSSFSKGIDNCLRNKPESLLDSATCGNGIVEAGEQCDCGTLARDTYNPCHACCDPHTCMPRANATCGAGRCCDLQTCRPMPAGTLCRAAARECDLPEYCGGHSALCPDDVHKIDATPCGKDEESAYCVEGQCRSHSSQCRVLWGSTAESCANFYDFNLSGNGYGDCGYDRLTQVYNKCSPANVMCGRLQCKSKGISLQIGSGDYINGIEVMANERTVACRTVSVDLGLDVVDFGMVPDGAKCGEGMMCLKKSCVSVAAIRERMSHIHPSVCPFNCSGHGVCNSKGNCHCDLGFAPPFCAQPGPGGSYDSEPATDPTILTKFMVAMYAIFLGIIPGIALVLIMIYCWRQYDLQACKKYQQKSSFTPTDFISCVAGNETPTYDTTVIVEKEATAVICTSSVMYANIEEISIRKTENQRTIPLVLPLKNCNQMIDSGYSQVQPKVKPTPNLDNLSRKNRKLEQTDKELIKSKPQPLVRPKPISNLVSELEANAKVDNSEVLKIKPLVKTRPNSHKSTGEIQNNAQVAKSDGLKIKPLVKPKPNAKILKGEPQANAQFASNDAVKIRPLMKPKPNFKNLENEPQANAQFASNDDAVKIRPLMKPKPNSKNLENEPQANAQFASNDDAVKIRPLMKPKPNSKYLENEPQANAQFASNDDAVKIRPLMKPKPNSKYLENEPQANAQFASNDDAVKIRPLMKPKPNSKNLENEPQANAQFASNDAIKIKPLMKPKPHSKNLASEAQANIQADNSGTLKIKPLVKTKPNPKQ